MEQWDTIYKNNASKMLGVCRRYIKDNEEAEDLMHNAFMTAMNKIDSYSGLGSFEGWLRKIVINTALLHLRSNKRYSILDNEPVENYSEPIHEEEYTSETHKNIIEEANFSKQELLETVDELPNHHKMVFNLYVIDGYKHNEIGKMLNISAGTSKSHLARARKKIQQLLFEKAKNKNERKKRFLFFFFFPKQNYIDKLYQHAFESFEIQPQKQTGLKEGAQLVDTKEKVSVLKKLIRNKIILISSFCSVLSIVVIALFLLYTKSTTIQQNQEQNQQKNSIETKPDKSENLIINLPSKKTDSIVPIKQNTPVQIKKKTAQLPTTSKSSDSAIKVDSAITKKPVVIHKSVIKHDTVTQKVPIQK